MFRKKLTSFLTFLIYARWPYALVVFIILEYVHTEYYWMVTRYTNHLRLHGAGSFTCRCEISCIKNVFSLGGLLMLPQKDKDTDKDVLHLWILHHDKRIS